LRNLFGTLFAGAIFLASFFVIRGAYSGISVWMGAHPWWAIQVCWIGVGAGLPLTLSLTFLRLSFYRSLIISVIFLLLAAWVAMYGKQGFAASYAEDWLAGKLWYYGSIAVAAAVFTNLFVLIFAASKKLTS